MSGLPPTIAAAKTQLLSAIGGVVDLIEAMQQARGAQRQ